MNYNICELIHGYLFFKDQIKYAEYLDDAYLMKKSYENKFNDYVLFDKKLINSLCENNIDYYYCENCDIILEKEEYSYIQRQIPLSLTNFLKLGKGTKRSLDQMSRSIRNYGKTNKLIMPDNRKIIIPDTQLIKLFNLNENENIHFHTIFNKIEKLLTPITPYKCKECNMPFIIGYSEYSESEG
jgi:hypothetical protein